MFANNLIICNTWKIFLTGKYSFQEKIITSRSSSPPLKRTSEDLHLHLKISIFKIFYITFLEGKIFFPGKDLPSRRTSSFQEKIFWTLNLRSSTFSSLLIINFDLQFWSAVALEKEASCGAELWKEVSWDCWSWYSSERGPLSSSDGLFVFIKFRVWSTHFV